MYKPYGVISQFTPEHERQSLADFGQFPKDVYPVGRLDADSEGLLLLTNDNELKHKLTEPKFNHAKTYYVQIEGIPDHVKLEKLRNGIIIERKKTKKSEIKFLDFEPELPLRSVPIRYRKNVPTSWLEITLTEGRNRQIRKMTAAIGHPTLRLVRKSIIFLSIKGLSPGTYRELTEEELTKLKSIIFK